MIRREEYDIEKMYLKGRRLLLVRGEHMAFLLLTKLDKVWEHILNHVAVYILGVLGAACLPLIMIFKTWILAEHQIILPGWFIVAIVLLSLSSIVFVAREVFDRLRPKGIKHEKDVIMRLVDYTFKKRQSCRPGVYIWDYDDIDYELGFRSGCTRKYLAEVLNQSREWQVISMGKEGLSITPVFPTRPYP